jgi:pimeloyl-ACP methyl ester carboxylesterase
MERTFHRARAGDGTGIGWSSAGTGAPAVVLTDGIGCAGYVWRHLEPALASSRRVIHWQYRGHGESDPPSDPARMTIDDCVEDLVAVLDDAGEERVALVGHSMGVQVAVEAHRRHPERVAALVLVCGAPGRPIDTFHDSSVLRAAFPFARALVERFPGPVRTAFRAIVPTELALQYALAFEVDRTRVAREDLVRYLDDLARVDPTLFVRLLASAAEHDTQDHLPAVDVPTLVVAGERDSFTPMRLSVKMHEAVTGSELLLLPGGTHVGPLEHPLLLAERVNAFLAAHLAPPPERRRTPAKRAAAKRAPARRASAGSRKPARRRAVPRRTPGDA